MQEPNWDGGGAEPVSAETLYHARNVLMALPQNVSKPDLGVEADGDVTLEWYEAPARTLSVSVGARGELHYAAIIGATRQYGTESFLGEVPQTILELIQRVLA